MAYKRFSYDFIPTPGSDVSALITQILCENPLAAASAAHKSAEAFTRITRRALGATGSFLFRELKAAFKENTLGLEPLARYSRTGVVMASHLRKNPVWIYGRSRKTERPFIDWGSSQVDNGPGSRYSGLMQYFMDDVDEQNTKTLEIGLIPSRRGGNKWAQRFSDWQTQGAINMNAYARGTDVRKMRAYFGAIGMPLSAGKVLTRPARPVVSRIEYDHNPVKLFEQFFLERLLA